MPHVINRNYSKFYDVKTRVQFDPILDRTTNTKIAHAHTTACYDGRPNFQVLSDEQYSDIVNPHDRAADDDEVIDNSLPDDPIAAAAANSRSRTDTPPTSDSIAGRQADNRMSLKAGDMNDPASPAIVTASTPGGSTGRKNGKGQDVAPINNAGTDAAGTEKSETSEAKAQQNADSNAAAASGEAGKQEDLHAAGATSPEDEPHIDQNPAVADKDLALDENGKPVAP